LIEAIGLGLGFGPGGLDYITGGYQRPACSGFYPYTWSAQLAPSEKIGMGKFRSV